MKVITFYCLLIVYLCCDAMLPAAAQQNEYNRDGSLTADYIPATWKEVGSIPDRDARQIRSSRWSIGGETLDRDYADYDAYKKYLGPLGAKRIRLQGGWAKTEKAKGKYDWTWMDNIVNDAVRRGISPWIETSYGNPVYEGGGDAAIGGGIPTADAALQAWDRWVRSLVNRYKDKVNEWEIWNEPNGSHKYNAEQYAAFFIRTADVIRQEQPHARIIALALAGVSSSSLDYARRFLSYLSGQGKLSLIDIISYHIYPRRPESAYESFEQLNQLVKSYSKDIDLWQGETGCPSTASSNSSGALSHFDWTETSQAKWILRRMFDQMNHANEIAVTSIFQISDMDSYNGGKDNTKGLLKTNRDRSIAHVKPAYYAMKHVTAIFDSSIRYIADMPLKSSFTDTIESIGFSRSGKTAEAFSIWFSGEVPSSAMKNNYGTITIEHGDFRNPVYVDMLSGKIYKISRKDYSNKGHRYIFKHIPVLDMPVLIASANFISNN